MSFYGSPGWTRTSDMRINSPAFYQLNYWGRDSVKRGAMVLNDPYRVKRVCDSRLP